MEGRRDRPVILLDLSSACSELSLLLHCADVWVPEENWQTFADEVRTHLRSVMDIIEKFIAKQPDLTALDDRLDEVIGFALTLLRKELSGRTCLAPGERRDGSAPD